MTAVLELANASKTFAGGRRVLQGVSLTIAPGEIHGLVGQNGSGKSTLVKILSGYHAPDPGAVMKIDGNSVGLPLSPQERRVRGLSFVHQDLCLAEDLSLVDNVRVGSYTTGLVGNIRWRHEREITERSLEQLGLRTSVERKVRTLPQSSRAIVAIARALQEMRSQCSPGLLVLDEPTPHLGRGDVEQLFNAIREVVRDGRIGILFISHRIDEIRAITNRVTVLRDGKVVEQTTTAALTEDRLVELIVGRKIDELYPVREQPTAERIAEVRGIAGAGVSDVSFDVLAGEIVGITGLLGMGAEEIPYLLGGSRRVECGSFRLRGRELATAPIRERIRAGLGVVPANRGTLGAAGELTARENMSIAKLGALCRFVMIDRAAEVRHVEDLMNAMGVEPDEPERTMKTFSGGNQQKAILGKWIGNQPAMLILHEPTQGVDIGARQEIFRHLRDVAKNGCGIIIVSMEYEDLSHLCDRVLVMRDGQVMAELASQGLTEARIVEYCYRTR